ncbi:DUF2304 domain-containing protein [Georgenia sp. Z1344]|uniref:DUF2304 domain-containing protein n=1 Tax=Georgenia sp. Z1344 TaxID=3416706 RepID=UPI003CEE29B1
MPVSGDTRIIQILLLVAVVAFTVLLTRSTAGSRHQAIRRLGLLGFMALAAISVLFPSWVSSVARFVGVGRGTDLVLYILVVVFFGYVVVTARGHARRDRQTTILARRLAIREADGEVRRAPSGTPHTPDDDTRHAPDDEPLRDADDPVEDRRADG